tara:strand:+ start:18290 stop:18955 length:666 start_codon:yes stop_codon:yes gene_type:complete
LIVPQHPYSVLSAKQIQGQLIFTPCPGTQDTSLAEALATLKEAGASALLTLMPTEELHQNAVDDLPQQCQQHGIEWFHLPVEDDQAPAEPFQAAWDANRERIKQLLSRPLKNVGEAAETRQKQARKRSLRVVNEHSEPVFNAVSATQVVFQRPVSEGKHIAIHCKGGSGRTGLIATQLLIECGVPLREAISQVQALRPRALQHPAHVQYIAQFEPVARPGN